MFVKIYQVDYFFNGAYRICCDIANHLVNQKSGEEAISFYKKALSYSESHVASRLSLAKLYLQRNEIDFCQKECTTMLQKDEDNIEAAMVLNLQTAIFHSIYFLKIRCLF